MSDTIEPTPAETSVLAELFSTTRRQSNLAILRAHVAAEVAKATGELLNDRERYHELLYAVGTKYENETRHQTALRYITEREDHIEGPSMDAARAQQKDTP